MRFWLATAFLDSTQLVDTARVAEEAGFHGLMVSDHIAYPERIESPYPYTEDGSPPFDANTPWPDAWVAIGAMATVTERLHFSNNVYVAGARPLFVVAKQVATAAVLSGGRVSLGVGAGWMREEFDLMGQPFKGRGARLDEMLEVVRSLWTGDVVEHHGEFYDFDAVSIRPVPPERVPVYVGGETDHALARAARNDGWIGGVYSAEEALELLERVHRALGHEGREPGEDFEIILAVYALDDIALFERLGKAGVTGLVNAPWMLVGEDPGERLDAIRSFGVNVIEKMR